MGQDLRKQFPNPCTGKGALTMPTTQSASSASSASSKPAAGKFQGQTGPKSEAGKNRSRFNSLKHSRHAKSKVLPYEDEGAYKNLIKAVFKDLNPEGAIEEDLAMQFVDSFWRRSRMEDKIRSKNAEIFGQLDASMMARMLNVPEQYIDFAPDYLLNMSLRIGPKQTELADYAWSQYESMVRDYESGQLTNIQEICAHYSALFEYVQLWFREHPQVECLYTPQKKELHPYWVKESEQLLEIVDIVGAELYYRAHFSGWKEQIRNWMQIWYLSQKSGLREIDQYDLVLIKEVHLSQCIIEKLMKLQKFKADGLAYLGRQLLWQEQIIAASKGGAPGMAKLQNEMPKTHKKQ
jgi:hypothetical protein